MGAKKDKIVLIGMPGCGKTTLGKILAEKMNYNFCDMDDYIVEIAGQSIPELFEKGEDVFRNWETEACRQLSNKKKTLISCGGGVVKNNENVKILDNNSVIIFIDRPVEEIAKDVNVSTRPLLKDGTSKLYELYKERYELYKKAAHIEIKNEGLMSEVIDKCINSLKGIVKE